MNSVYVDQARLTADRIYHRVSGTEAVLTIGNQRLPVSRNDVTAVREAIIVAERLATAAVFWKSDLEAIHGQLEHQARERQNAHGRDVLRTEPGETTIWQAGSVHLINPPKAGSR
ncbi:hypothetical protein [Nonomuraea typhae]|uniref:Uncharacterized protein n=1 Tax=Nonomuraea typhae TaxID=2603600 RepID=A0ABW7YXV2_9ACTN